MQFSTLVSNSLHGMISMVYQAYSPKQAGVYARFETQQKLRHFTYSYSWLIFLGIVYHFKSPFTGSSHINFSPRLFFHCYHAVVLGSHYALIGVAASLGLEVSVRHVQTISIGVAQAFRFSSIVVTSTYYVSLLV